MNNNGYFPVYQPQGPAFARPYQQGFAQQMPMQQMPAMPVQQMQPMMQDGSIQARFVSGREEAVASSVMPGSMFLFHDRANGMIYSKLIDPQTGMPDFRVYAEVRPEQQAAPQYVTMDALNALREEFEQRLAALTPTTKRGKAVESDV